MMAEFLLTFSKINQFYLKLNNKRYKNITVVIYLIFMQYIKHKKFNARTLGIWLDDKLR